VAGVVNFITRTDLNGFEAEGEYSHIDGSKGDYHANLAWGWKFDEGNILLTAGYRRRSRLDIHDRDWAVRPFEFGGYNGSGGWTGAANPGFYQNASTATFLFRDNGCAELGGTLTNNVTFPNPLVGQLGQTAANVTVAVPVNPASPVSAGPTAATASTCRFQFSNFNDLVNKEDHYQLYGEVNFEFAENQKFHAEVGWNRNDVPNQRLSPANLNTQFPTPTALGGESGSLRPPGALNFFVPFNVPSNNPGLVALYTNCQAPLDAATCANIRTAANAVRPATSPLGGSGLPTQGIDISQTTFRSIAFAGHPTNPDKADHQDIEETEFRISGGVKGELPWFGIGYDAALTYMEGEQTVNTNDLLVDRIQLALNGFGSLSSDPGSCTQAERAVAANAGNTAVGCYFFNPFTNAVQTSAVNGQPNPYARANLANDPRLVEWLYGNYTNQRTETILVADLVFNGKSGFNLPGGEVAWAAGYQWRYNKSKQEFGDLFNNKATPCVDSIVDNTPACLAPNGPLIFFGSDANFEADRAVWAVFGEIQLPVFDTFEINAAVRHEDYPGGIGSTTNPKVAVKWQALDWLAFRGTAGTTFRAPTIAAASANCAVGVANLGGQYRAVRTCGNTALKPEKSDAFSAGAIVAMGGFKATLDWYKFNFTDELTAESSSGLFTALTTTPNGCGIAELVARFQFDNRGCFQDPNTKLPSPLSVLRVDVNNVNGPKTVTSGFDLRAEYDWDNLFLDGSNWQVGLEGTYLREYKRGDFVLNGTAIVFQAAFDRAGKHDLTSAFYSYPKYKANGWLQVHQGPLSLRWQVRYQSGTSPAPGTTFFVERANPAAIATGGYDLVYTGRSKDYWQHDLIVRWEAPWDTVITASVQNLFDKDPPYVASQFNYDYTTGNPLGRVFEIGAKKTF
jgi:iron complex outermembrane receptor protein